MLKLQDINKNFKKTQVLKDISLTLDNGIYGLLGPNGAGKTTLMRCILGLLPYTGSVGSGSGEMKIGYLPQKFGLFKDWTVRDALEYFAVLKNIPQAETQQAIDNALELVNLSDSIDTKCGKLSGGMVRRVGIAQSILDNPPILIVDEPTAGLDPEERMRFKVLISKLRKDRIIIISTHITDDVDALCDHVIIIDKGTLKGSFTLQEVKEKAEGKVFLMPETEALQAGEIIKTFEKDGVSCARVLSPNPLTYERAEPTVEDGYLCVIKDM